MKAEKTSKRSELNKLSRLELVELIYDIRQDNLSLEARCRELEARLAVMEQMDNGDLSQRLSAIEKRLDDTRIQVNQNTANRVVGIENRLAKLEKLLAAVANRVSKDSDGRVAALEKGISRIETLLAGMESRQAAAVQQPRAAEQPGAIATGTATDAGNGPKSPIEIWRQMRREAETTSVGTQAESIRGAQE